MVKSVVRYARIGGPEGASEEGGAKMLKNHWFWEGSGAKVVKNVLLSSRKDGSGRSPGKGDKPTGSCNHFANV